MIELFVPGRLCLFGEHSDWAGALRRDDPEIEPGACIVAGTDQGIWAEVSAADDFAVSGRLPGGGVEILRLPLQSEALRRAATARGFFSYAAGVAAIARERYGPLGVEIHERGSDLPMARGLSSSAAICVLTARAFNRVHRLGLDVRAEMELAYRGELAAGSRCGRMDQACAYGRRLTQLDFDGDELRVHVLQPGGTLHLLIVDLQRPKDTRRILQDLHVSFSRGGEIRAALGGRNRELVGRARRALEAGDAAAVGALMGEAQDLFDRAVAPSSEELRAPRLHAVLRHPAARDLSWGGKGVGSQGDGAAQFICRGEPEREELARVLAAENMGICLPLSIEPTIGRDANDSEFAGDTADTGDTEV